MVLVAGLCDIGFWMWLMREALGDVGVILSFCQPTRCDVRFPECPLQRTLLQVHPTKASQNRSRTTSIRCGSRCSNSSQLALAVQHSKTVWTRKKYVGWPCPMCKKLSRRPEEGDRTEWMVSTVCFILKHRILCPVHIAQFDGRRRMPLRWERKMKCGCS